MQIGRPVSAEFFAVRVGIADGGDVVGQRIDPHIHDVLGVAGHRDAPVEGRARDRQILQAAAHEARDLVQALLRQHEIRIAGIELEELVLIGREPEKIALLLDPFDRRALRAEALAVVVEPGFALVVIGLVAHRIPAGIFVEIDVAGRLHALPDRGGRAVVARLGGADEVVVRAIEHFHHGLEARHVALDKLARRQLLPGRGLQHLAAVLVGAGEEEHVIAVEPHEAGDGVGGDRLIGVADMRRAVRIRDRRGDVIGLGSHLIPLIPRRRLAPQTWRHASGVIHAVAPE